MVEAPSVSVCTWAPAQEEGARKGRSTVRSLTEEVDDELKKDVASYMISQLEDQVGLDNDVSDLHHYLLNEDYFIIGYYQAEQWLKKDSIFNAIETIKEYEQSNFGQVSTDFSSSEKVANMLAYILGEEILSESDIYQQIQFNKNILEEDDITNLIEDLKESFQVGC